MSGINAVSSGAAASARPNQMNLQMGQAGPPQARHSQWTLPAVGEQTPRGAGIALLNQAYAVKSQGQLGPSLDAIIPRHAVTVPDMFGTLVDSHNQPLVDINKQLYLRSRIALGTKCPKGRINVTEAVLNGTIGKVTVCEMPGAYRYSPQPAAVDFGQQGRVRSLCNHSVSIAVQGTQFSTPERCYMSSRVNLDFEVTGDGDAPTGNLKLPITAQFARLE